MPRLRHQFLALGTDWVIETDDELPKELKQTIDYRLSEFDKTYSRFRDDSLVRTMTDTSGMFEFPNDVQDIVSFYKKIYDVTGGKVTPLIGSALERAGYDKNYSLLERPMLPTPKWEEVMQWQGAIVTTTSPVVLDIGAAGKGYAVDIVAEILRQHGVLAYVIDASGDIQHRGKTIEYIGLEDPHNPSRVVGVMEVQNMSLCASASNRRRWGKWHHIIDPTNNQPVRDIIATWVVAESTMIADGLATALFFVSPEKLADWQFQYVRLYGNGRLEHSTNLKGELFV